MSKHQKCLTVDVFPGLRGTKSANKIQTLIDCIFFLIGDKKTKAFSCGIDVSDVAGCKLSSDKMQSRVYSTKKHYKNTTN